jgi:hypothetical protein
MPPKNTTRSQKNKKNVIVIEEDEIDNFSGNYFSLTVIVSL